MRAVIGPRWRSSLPRSYRPATLSFTAAQTWHSRTCRNLSTTRVLCQKSDVAEERVATAQELRQLLHDLDAASSSLSISSDALSAATKEDAADSLDLSPAPAIDDETIATYARKLYGDVLPAGLLSDSQYRVYERLYGTPQEAEQTEASDAAVPRVDNGPVGTGLLREGPDGALEEVDFMEEDDIVDEVEAEEDLEDALNTPEMQMLRKSKKGRFFERARKKEIDDKILYADMTRADEAQLAHLEKDWKAMGEDEKVMYLEDVRYFKLEFHLRSTGKDEEADELLQCLFIHFEASIKSAQQQVKIDEAAEHEEELEVDEEVEIDEAEPVEVVERAHPHTLANRFTTFPSTVQLPYSALVRPVSDMVSQTAPVHLAEATKRIFGGPGLPYSTSNPAFAKSLPQKQIPIDPSQTRLSDIEADSYLAAVMPGTYASVMSALVETRKRLGTEWLQKLLSKPGGPRILDAGSAGAAVLAFREVLNAEWQQLHDNSDDPTSFKDLTTAGGRAGGAPIAPPKGKATVLTSSDTMRKRASLLLDDTAFIPRLPDYVHASNPAAAQKGKFDIIFAPHTLWPLKETYLRKQYVANLWSLLDANGGVLILLEKGVPRGFEMIAGARKFLLDSRISSPESQIVAEEVAEEEEGSVFGVRDKEPGMIIAPCTNHAGCPMYTKSGTSAGRTDYCHFEQRYIRPPYLQKLLRARDKNHEDVGFSYLSIMRGRDLRVRNQQPVRQGNSATDRAFRGYEHDRGVDAEASVFDPTAPVLDDAPTSGVMHQSGPNGLSLPRAVFPPLKRTGHVILDLCTPSGTLERWTVPRSFSKQAFRDARKSRWGDLWALGAKTRVARSIKLGVDGKSQPHTINLKAVKLNAKAKKKLTEQSLQKKKKRAAPAIYDVPLDSETGKVDEAGIKPMIGGRMRRGKISGVRDRRDKTGQGRGRRRLAEDGV